MIIKSLRGKKLGIDFDGVICDSKNRLFFFNKEPMPNTKVALENLKMNGYKIIVYTSRTRWEKYWIEIWLKKNKIPYDDIITGKPIFRYIIDDNALEFERWDKTFESIMRGKNGK